MPREVIPHVKCVIAKGRRYYYFDTGQKKASGAKIYKRLPDLRSPKFWSTHAAYCAGRTKRANVAPEEAVRTVPDLIALYRKSPKWREHTDTTRRMYNAGLDYAERVFSIAPAADLQPADVEEYRDLIADKPGMANAFVRTMGALYAWARPRYVQNRPTDGIDELDIGEHAPWPDALLSAALKAPDPTVRLAVHMLYYTTQRIGDVMEQARWSDLKGATWTMTPKKTRKTYGEISIPLHRDLREELARHKPTGPMLFPMAQGTLRKRLQAFAKGLGHDVVPHGLRKNGVNALLEAGCTSAEAAAISRQSLAMIEHYSKRRNQDVLGAVAILKWEKK